MKASRNTKGNPKNDEFYTPAFIFEALNLEFDLDVAAPEGGVSWLPTKRYFTQKDDGLSQEWTGLVWCNPPYSAPKLWAEKWLNHGNGLMLIPATKGKWFRDLWAAADGMVIMNEPFKFEKPDDQRADIFMPTILASIGKTATNALIKSNLGRVR